MLYLMNWTSHFGLHSGFPIGRYQMASRGGWISRRNGVADGIPPHSTTVQLPSEQILSRLFLPIPTREVGDPSVRCTLSDGCQHPCTAPVTPKPRLNSQPKTTRGYMTSNSVASKRLFEYLRHAAGSHTDQVSDSLRVSYLTF